MVLQANPCRLIEPTSLWAHTTYEPNHVGS